MLGDDWIDEFFSGIPSKLTSCHGLRCGNENEDMICYGFNEKTSVFHPIDFYSRLMGTNKTTTATSEETRSARSRFDNSSRNSDSFVRGDASLRKTDLQKEALSLVKRLQSYVLQDKSHWQKSELVSSARQKSAKLAGKQSVGIKRTSRAHTKADTEGQGAEKATGTKQLASEIMHRLKALQHLLDLGVISKAEFDSQRKNIIASI